MSIWEAALLGLVQGLTEFLPVSSSGHLVLGQHALGVETEAANATTFEVFLHFGTVMSIATVYWRELSRLFAESFSAMKAPSRIKESYAEKPYFRMSCAILLSMIPTGLTYVLFKDRLEAAFSDPRLVAAMLLVTGTLLMLTTVRRKGDGEVTAGKGFLLGCAQSLALLPGISRSGSTIAAALFSGVEREKAANFSFLMSFPVIVGATLIKVLELFEGDASMALLPVLAGMLVAYGSGIWAIRTVINVVKKGKIVWFAAYCFAVGILGLIFLP